MLHFDPKKDGKNIRRHHISLSRADEMTDILYLPDTKHSEDEERWHAIGLIDGRVYLAVITYRDGEPRPISLRPASKRERRLYGEAT